MDRRIKQGKTLKKVREIKEKAAAQQQQQAQAEADERARACHERKEQLANLEMAVQAKALDGMSMAEFMQFQSMRTLHEGAVQEAQLAERHALKQLDECKGELLAASRLRRAAEKWLDNSMERWEMERKRAEQKSVDDNNCIRAAKGQ